MIKKEKKRSLRKKNYGDGGMLFVNSFEVLIY